MHVVAKIEQVVLEEWDLPPRQAAADFRSAVTETRKIALEVKNAIRTEFAAGSATIDSLPQATSVPLTLAELVELPMRDGDPLVPKRKALQLFGPNVTAVYSGSAPESPESLFESLNSLLAKFEANICAKFAQPEVHDYERHVWVDAHESEIPEAWHLGSRDRLDRYVGVGRSLPECVDVVWLSRTGTFGLRITRNEVTVWDVAAPDAPGRMFTFTEVPAEPPSV